MAYVTVCSIVFQKNKIVFHAFPIIFVASKFPLGSETTVPLHYLCLHRFTAIEVGLQYQCPSITSPIYRTRSLIDLGAKILAFRQTQFRGT